LSTRKGNPVLLFAGVALVVGAIIVDAIAYRAHAVSQSAAGRQGGRGRQAKAATWKGIKLAVIGGILMGMFYPLVEIGKKPGPRGLGPTRSGSSSVWACWFRSLSTIFTSEIPD
jgi:glucose uptake protein